MTLALYPGSFDPLTNGHLNLIHRGLKLFDKLVVAVARNVRKQGLFSVEERMAMIQSAVAVDAARVEVSAFEGLLVDYAHQVQASCILRGLRAVSDFEFEFQLAHMNRRLGSGLETVFMMTGEEHFYVSSQLVREIASFGGTVTGLVPDNVERKLKEKFAK
ncbi:MAG TPA: pantetheine-phosphate adenylyltransferase [Myxococcota bacterium]|nr:pantetheine-phosphate adenylyltransferase [Myxococcota bacterium]